MTIGWTEIKSTFLKVCVCFRLAGLLLYHPSASVSNEVDALCALHCSLSACQLGEMVLLETFLSKELVLAV